MSVVIQNNFKFLRRAMVRLFLAVMVLLFAFDASSEDLSFDYVQANYFSDTINPANSIDDVEGNGIGFIISLSASPAFAVTFDVAATTFRAFQGMGVDSSKTTKLGVTTHTAVASGTEIFANASIVSAEIIASDATADDFGGAISLGLRYQISDAFELEVSTSRTKVFDNTVNLYAIDTRYYFRKYLSAGFGYSANDDIESLVISGRLDI